MEYIRYFFNKLLKIKYITWNNKNTKICIDKTNYHTSKHWMSRQKFMNCASASVKMSPYRCVRLSQSFVFNKGLIHNF